MNLKKLKKFITDFETVLKTRNYKMNEKITLPGYLVNLKDYEELKKIIFSNNNNINKILTIESIHFKTASYLVNMIYNDNKYIIISPEIWKNCLPKEKENENPIFYEVNREKISIKLEDNNLTFSNFNLNNIIEKSSYYTLDNPKYESNYEEIKKIYEIL